MADSRRGEYALIAAIDANEGDMLDWQDITTANQKATNFLQNCIEFANSPANNLDVLHDAFVRASSSINLVNNTMLVLLTPGRVGGSSKERARALDLRTEIMDLDEFLQVSEHSLLNIEFSQIR